MAVVNEHGATATTLNEYLEQIRQAHLAIDPDWNIEPESPDGLRIAIEAELLANLDEAVLQAYRSVDPLSAVGQQLDRLAFISGLTRLPATPSTATVTFTGTTGTVIPAGTQVRNSQTDTLWTTDVEVTITGGTATVGVTCTKPGPEPAAVGALSIIASPVGGVQSVTNTAAASLGRPEESDTLFRKRRNLSVAKPSANQVDSMFAALANVEGVSRVKVYENPEPVADANGLAPHSLAAFVDGGDVEAIAKAMAATKCPGTGLNAGGSWPNKVQLATTTPGGSPFNATFYRPALTTIYVQVTVSGNVPAAVEQEIKEAIIAYANATLFDVEADGFDRDGFDIGDVITAGSLFTPVNKTLGGRGYATAIKIGTEPADITHDSIDPGFNGLGVFDADAITVTRL